LLLILFQVNRTLGWDDVLPGMDVFLFTLQLINFMLLVFNLLPIYPLDGGQILRALLWFPLGRGRSLQVATLVGFVGLVGLVGCAVLLKSFWIGIMCLFAALNCWRGWQESRQLLRTDALPRRGEFACPVCGESPPVGNLWICAQCRQSFDTFATDGNCPHCAAHYEVTSCATCGNASPRTHWRPRSV
jgi:hypothetical protein